MTKSNVNRFALGAALSVGLALPGFAANSLYSPGDLVLFVQEQGGSNTIYASLGSVKKFAGAGAGDQDTYPQLNTLDLGPALASAYGANWGTNPNLYVGLASANGFNNTGDPFKTVYVSSPRVGVSNIWDSASSAKNVSGTTAMNRANSQITAMMTPFENDGTGAIEIMPTSTSLVDDYNPFFGAGQGTAFGTFAGGIQGVGSASTFGTIDGFESLGDIEFALDLQRLDPTSGVGGQFAATHEGSIVLGSNGQVSFIPEPSSVSLFGLAAGALLFRRRRNG